MILLKLNHCYEADCWESFQTTESIPTPKELKQILDADYSIKSISFTDMVGDRAHWVTLYDHFSEDKLSSALDTFKQYCTVKDKDVSKEFTKFLKLKRITITVKDGEYKLEFLPYEYGNLIHQI